MERITRVILNVFLVIGVQIHRAYNFNTVMCFCVHARVCVFVVQEIFQLELPSKKLIVTPMVSNTLAKL